ncbi:endonuclease domain-containing protein [Naasia sp. SYSU D00057]|uniref:endonuclease domain-containing protein n=1 Tax=Naasia sp. SYSU D00057 TaxID=2817380 RepID=UPI001B30E8A4|nr:DUF559 domain-containing protein [Naasia sp. SYSU D00057]
MTLGGVQRSLQDGRLQRVVRGWYAEPGTDPDLIRAMQLGGRPGCVSALRLYGAWCPPDTGLHLAMPFSAAGRRLRNADPATRDGVTVHWHSKVDRQEWSEGVSSLPRAIAHAVECQPADYAVAILDSLLFRRIASEGAVLALLAGLPPHLARVAQHVDGRSEEGIESIARYRLQLSGIRAEPQVVVPGVGRVDLLIDGWLVIELDGRSTHAQEGSFSRDRRRTALLNQRGLTVLHFSYAHVIYEWPLVLETVMAVLARH